MPDKSERSGHTGRAKSPYGGWQAVVQRVQYGVMKSVAWLFLVLCVSTAFASPQQAAEAPRVDARAAILMDRQSGMVLWSLNPDQELPMASTTKIMTAMIILDRGRDRLHEAVTVSKHAFTVASGGSSQFAAGDTVTLGDLLKSALIRSSNEATTAAAEYLAGDEQTFIGWMNEKAQQLGLQHTHFTNPHGFTKPQYYAKNHYSSVRDLALMAREALANYPEIRELVATRYAEARTSRLKHPLSLDNTNKILGKEVPGIPGSRVDGVKTGYIKLSGQCFIGSATVKDWQLIAVLLDDKNRFEDALTLFHYGYTRYAWKTYASASQPGLHVPIGLGAVPVVPLGVRGSLGAPVLRPEYGGSTQDTVVFSGKGLRAPLVSGHPVGTLTLLRDGKPIASAPAITLATVPMAWWVRAGTALLAVLVFLSLLVIASAIYGTRTKNARRRRRQLQAGGGGTD